MNKIENSDSNINQTRLAREIPRALRALDKHGDVAALSALHALLVPEAMAFLQTREAKRALLLQVRQHQREAHQQVAAVRDAFKVWRQLVEHDVPNFDGGAYDTSDQTPDQTFDATESFVQLVDGWSDDERPDYADALVQELRDALELARQQWLQAQALLGELQQARAVAREAAEPVYRRMSQVRRVLRRILGASHRDYAALRPRRGNAQAEPEAATAATTEAATDPATTSEALGVAPENDLQAESQVA